VGGPIPLLQAEIPTAPATLSHLHPSPAAAAQPVLQSCIQFFRIAHSGTPGSSVDCDKSLDGCLFELSGMHLNLNVVIS